MEQWAGANIGDRKGQEAEESGSIIAAAIGQQGHGAALRRIGETCNDMHKTHAFWLLVCDGWPHRLTFRIRV